MGKPRSASKVALSEVSVRPGRSGAGGVGPSDGRAPLPGIPVPVRRRAAARRGDGGRALGGAGRVGAGFVQGEGAGRLDRLGAGAAVPAAASGGEQHALPDPAGAAWRQPGVASAVAVAAPAVVGHGSGARPSGAGRGDLRGPGAVRGHVLPGVELDRAGRDAGLRPRRRRLDGARGAEAGVRAGAGGRRAGGAFRTRRAGVVGRRARLSRAARRAPAAQPVRLPARGARVPLGARRPAPAGDRAGGRRGGQARRRPGRHRDLGVRRPAFPAPARRGARVPQSVRQAAGAAVEDQHPPHPLGTGPRCAGRRRAALHVGPARARRDARARRQVQGPEPPGRPRCGAHDDRRRRARQRRGARPDRLGRRRRRDRRSAPPAARTRRRRAHRHPRRPAELPEDRATDRRRRRRLRHAGQAQPRRAARRHPHPRLRLRAVPKHPRQGPRAPRAAHLRRRPP